MNAFSNSGLTEMDIPDSVVMNEKQVKLISEINGKNAAQIMLVVGTDEGGSSHGGWLGNFTAAVHLQNKINEMYPTLARPIYLRTASFNQDLSPGRCLSNSAPQATPWRKQ